MSLSTASIILLHSFFILLTFLLAAVMTSSIPVAVEHGDVNTTATTTTTTFSNSSTTSSSPADDDKDNFEMYFCFLCSGRDPLLIHHCPIYWDQCHLICDDDMSPSTTTTVVGDDAAAIPMATAAPAPPAAPSSSSSAHPMAVQGGDYEDCYVMKLYMSGRYVIVEHRPCKYIAWCFLTCGGGELAGDRNVIMGSTRTTMPATIQGSILAAELCGTQHQFSALSAPPSAGVVVVPAAAGGAH